MSSSHLIRCSFAFIALLGLVANAAAQSGTADAATIVSATAAEGTFPVRSRVTFTLTYSTDVTVTGIPYLNLTVGGVARRAYLDWYGSNARELKFVYSPDFNEGGAVVVQSPINLGDAVIRATSGVPVQLDFTPPDTSKTIIDTVLPTKPVIRAWDATSSTPGFSGTADPGNAIRISGINTNPDAPAATAAADGTWNIPWTGRALPPGSYSFSAWATNAAGNESSSESVTVTVAPTAVPVVSPVSDLDITWHYRQKDYPEKIHITATNAPTSFTVTGLPPKVEAYDGPGFTQIYWTYGTITGGKYTTTVTATNSVGTSAPMTFNWTIHPSQNGSTLSDKYRYNLGETITFTASFSAPVVVTGTPFIPLWDGKKAMYVGGSGTNKLTFQYQTTRGDPLGTGLYYSTIDANGGTITTVDGVSADLANSYWGLGDPPKFYIYDATLATPVITAATITGQVGTPITPVQLQATNSPESFSYTSAITDHGLFVSKTGLVSGTPTRAAAGVTVPVYASNSTGRGEGTLTLNLSPAPTTTPTKTDQTIAFSSPVSALIVGQPVQLGATSSAGLPITYTVISGSATISGNSLTPTGTAPLIVRAASAGSDTVNPAATDVNFGSPQKAAQTISLATPGGSVPAEKPVTLAATASSGLPVTYTVVSGPATIVGDTLTFTGTGNVIVRAAQAGDGTYASTDTTLTFTANPIDRLVNLSSRAGVGSDDSRTTIAGFVVTGSAPTPVLIRAVGPTLANYGVTSPAAAPVLQLLDRNGQVLATNQGWNNNAQISAASARLGAFALPADSKDAAVLVTLPPGLYTAKVNSAAAGEALVEVYDGSATAAVPTKQLVNISSRAYVDGTTSLIGGFSVSGADTKRVLIRAVGPGLTPYGVGGALSDPAVKVYDVQGTLIAQSDNWETALPVSGRATPATSAQISAAGSASGAFALQSGSKDAAVVLTLAPGSYTAVVSGANGTTGAALVEVYEVP